MNLIQLSEMEQDLFERLSDPDTGETALSEEQQAQIIDEYLSAKDAFEEKADRYAYLIRGIKARAEFRNEEMRRFRKLANADSRLASLLEERLILVLQNRGSKTLQTPHFKLRVQTNGGLPPLIIPQEWEQEPAKAPEQFHRKVIELDKVAIRQEIKDGNEVEGCRIGEPAKRLSIS